MPGGKERAIRTETSVLDLDLWASRAGLGCRGGNRYANGLNSRGLTGRRQAPIVVRQGWAFRAPLGPAAEAASTVTAAAWPRCHAAAGKRSAASPPRSGSSATACADACITGCPFQSTGAFPLASCPKPPRCRARLRAWVDTPAEPGRARLPRRVPSDGAGSARVRVHAGAAVPHPSQPLTPSAVSSAVCFLVRPRFWRRAVAAALPSTTGTPPSLPAWRPRRPEAMDQQEARRRMPRSGRHSH